MEDKKFIQDKQQDLPFDGKKPSKKQIDSLTEEQKAFIGLPLQDQ